MIRSYLNYLFVLITLLMPMNLWAQFAITPEPLLETCAITVDYTNSSATNTVEYRNTGTGTWKNAFPLVWDPNSSKFTGSIVNLEEETDYDVRVTFFVGGSQNQQSTSTFSTWVKTENLPVGVTVIDGKYVDEAAVKIKSFNGYVILEDLIIRGGKRYGIKSYRSSNIRIN